MSLHENTIRQHTEYIKRFIAPTLGDFEINKILPIHRDLVLEKANQVSAGTGRRTVITFRRVLRYARKLGISLKFDIDDIDVPVYRKVKDTQALSLDEIEAVRRYFGRPRSFGCHASRFVIDRQNLATLRTRALFELLLHTGFRLSEALSINKEDVDFQNHEIRFVNVKSKEWETVYLFGAENELREYLSKRDDKEAPLFLSNSGKRLSVDTAHSYLKIIKKRIGLKKNLNHQLFRSTFVTIFLRNKADPRQTQILARHKSIQTTLIYYYAVEKERLKPLHKEIMGLI